MATTPGHPHVRLNNAAPKLRTVGGEEDLTDLAQPEWLQWVEPGEDLGLCLDCQVPLVASDVGWPTDLDGRLACTGLTGSHRVDEARPRR